VSNYSASHFDSVNENTSWYKAFHLIDPGSSVLDIGCSSGNFGEALINMRSCVVDGIEIAPDDIIEAKTKLRTVYSIDIERDSLNEITNRYDVIYFGDVIEHLITPSKTLKRVATLLKPDGRLVFSVPNMAYLAVRLDLLEGRFEYTETGLLDNTHLHYYDRVEIERVIGEAGYDLTTLDYVSKDYPRSIIDETLSQMGLSANEAFYTRMSSPEASAFQWIGMAQYTGKKMAVRRREFGPVDKFEILIHEVEAAHAIEISDKNAKIAALETQNDHFKQRMADLHDHPVRTVQRHVTARIKKKLS
jgi:2-polyprenyl-3-methyl-5-hydroxy-6-metoxy-1,4-benzoquinol methylase